MLTLLLNYLKSKWLYAMIAAAITAVAATFLVQRLEITHLERELQRCRAATVTLEDSNKALLASLNSQNAAIARMHELSAARAKAASHALGIAKTSARKYALVAAQIEARKTSGDTCATLRDLVNDFVR